VHRVTLSDLVSTDHPTALGPIRLWSPPDGTTATRPVLITVTGPFASADTMARLPAVMGAACDCHLMHLPGNHAPPIRDMTVDGIARALREVIDTAFAGRLVILHGLSVGALVALAVRSAAVRKVVAVEPPLSTAKLWPLIPRLQAQLDAAPADEGLARFLDGVFGLTAGGVRDVRYHRLFDGERPPAEVLVGDAPLLPPRDLDRAPSFLDEADRAFLRRQPGVALQVAPGAGHNVATQAPLVLKDLLLKACREAAGLAALTPVQQALFERTPATARRIAYRGAGASAFAAACRARNPQADIVDGEADVLVLESIPEPLGEPPSLLPPGGSLIAALPPSDAATAGARLAGVSGEGFEILQLQPLRPGEAFFDDEATNLAAGWRAGALPAAAAAAGLLLVARRAPTQPAPPATRLCLASFAPTLMDIRARLPAQALRSEPDLVVSHQRHDYRLPATEPEAPRILVLQRPALLEPAAWRQAMGNVIRAGWVVVLEFDDHPQLVAELTGAGAAGAADWRRFGYVHAVQTSTPELAEAFRAYNPEVRVFANAAFDLAPAPREAPRRVFYGAVTRGPFAVEVARSLAPTLRRFPDVEFVVVGDRAVFEALATANKRFLPLMGYADYLAEMSACAVSLSPVEPRPELATKSDAKFVEAASRGVVTIGSPVVYGRTIRHGDTGLLAATLDDWGPLLTQALADAPARRRMAAAAWRYVRDERMFAAQIAERRAWYEDLWRRRGELNAAVVGRLAELAR